METKQFEKLTDILSGLEKRFDGLEKKVNANHKFLQANAKRTAEIERNLKNFRKENKRDHEKSNNRLDMIGSTVAYIEEDAPTREEFDKLDKRVTKIEAGV